MTTTDPLQEDQNSPVKGLVHKYPKRVLLLLTARCFSYCDFCTRQRKWEDLNNSELTELDIENIINYLQEHSDLNEVILSGGDPLFVPAVLQAIINKIQKIKHIKIIRIHSRLPIIKPDLISNDLINFLQQIELPVYLSLHINHSQELNKDNLQLIIKLRKAGLILLSQTVLLKGINDSVEVLEQLFITLVELGIKPYYLHICDKVAGTERFWIDISRQIEIITALRERVSGIAYPVTVIDVAGGVGKIPLPTGHWSCDLTGYQDFNNKSFNV